MIDRRSAPLYLVTALALLPTALSAADAASAGPVEPMAAIGWKLFTDTQLSRPGTYSCASCHDPAKVFGDGLPKALGVYGDTLPRHTPRLTNLGAAELFYWDGRAESLEEQVLVPLTHPQEMDLRPEEIVERVRLRADYLRAFAAIGHSQPELEHITSALAAFVRALDTGENAYDRWLAGDAEALGPAEGRGRMIFFTRGQCATCHIGDALSDHDFHNVGTGTKGDPGRGAITGLEKDQGSFKTPSLRNWRGSEPFMHDGRFATLAEVIDFYSEPPPPEIGASELDPLELDADEKQDLLTFLDTLNGAAPDLGRFEQAWQDLLASQSDDENPQ